MYRLFIFAFSVFLLLNYSAMSWAKNSGYSGLIAPAKESSGSGSGAEPPSAYEGLMAPQDSKRGSGAQDAPPGYYGLIEGAVEEPVQQQKNFNRFENLQDTSSRLDAENASIPQTAEDVESMSTVYEFNKEADKIKHNLSSGQAKLSAEEALLLSRPVVKIDGKYPYERITSEKIKAMMAALEGKNLSDEEYNNEVRRIRDELTFMADNVRNKQSIPDKTYIDMGVPAKYIQDKKIDNQRTLIILNNTIRELKGF